MEAGPILNPMLKIRNRMKQIALYIMLLCIQCTNAQCMFFMYDNPNDLVLRSWAPHGWEYAAVNNPKNRGFIVSDSLVSIIFSLKQSLRDTVISDYTYTGVELLVACEKEGYGYDVFVCGSYDGDLLEVNGKPCTGSRLLKSLLYYIMYNHIYSAKRTKMNKNNENEILERYKEWINMKPQDIPSVYDLFEIQPTWIPSPPAISDTIVVHGEE